MNKRYIIFVAIISLFSSVAMAKSIKSDSTKVLRVTRIDWKPVLEEIFYPEGEKYEIGYTYSSLAPVNTHFPVGLYGEWAGGWAEGWVAFSGEIGVSVTKQTYTMSKDENATYDPLFYSMLGLGVNFNVFSINFNAGIADYKYATTTTSDFISITTNSHKIAAILQPSIHIHIPVDDFEHFISLKVGYNICPSMRDLNGLNIGIGFGGWSD